jgi:hypothetical protein
MKEVCTKSHRTWEEAMTYSESEKHIIRTLRDEHLGVLLPR